MKERLKKLWKTKRGLVVLVGLLVLISPCLCLGGLIALGSTAPVPTATQLPAIQPPSQPTPTVYHAPMVFTPTPTNTSLPTDTPTLEPTPTPTEIKEDGVSLTDKQFVLRLPTCVGEGALTVAMPTLSTALDTGNMLAIQTAATGIKVAAEEDYTCLDNLPYPDNPLLQDVHRFYGLGLNEIGRAMDYLSAFCEGDSGSLDLAASALERGSLYLKQSTEAMELFTTTMTE